MNIQITRYERLITIRVFVRNNFRQALKAAYKQSFIVCKLNDIVNSTNMLAACFGQNCADRCRLAYDSFQGRTAYGIVWGVNR